MSRERLELVKDFGELKAGMIVVVKRCHWCDGNDHRGILLGPSVSHFVFDNPDGNYEAMAFDVLPAPPCVFKGPCSDGYAVDAEDVDGRYVYRVIDGLEQSQATETRKSVSA